MKNIFLKFSVILCFLLFAGVPTAKAQWQSDVRLTNNSEISIVKSDKSIASSGSTLHVVWSDARHGVSEIYYKRSTNAGINWGSDTRLTNANSYSEEPSISAEGSFVHIVWKDHRDGNYEIYYKRSTNNGVNWSADTRFTDNSSNSYYPCISAGDYVHVVWTDEPIEDGKIFYRRSTNDGVSWNNAAQISYGSNLQQSPSISVSGSYVHIVWEDQRISVVNSEIFYRRSLNMGDSWGAETRLTSSSGYSEDPSVSSTGTDVHISWYDVRDGNQEIYYKRSTNYGANWENDVRQTDNSYISTYPSIAVSGPIVHIVWIDDRNGNEEIYYKRSINRGSSWGTDTRLTTNVYDSRFPSVALSDMVVNVIWADSRDADWEIYYKRNPNGNPDGIKKIDSEIPVSFALFQNYPNPFNPITNIKFSIPKSGLVRLVLYDIAGREVSIIADNILGSGNYNIDFDASNFTSGVYFYKMTSGDYTDVKKMILVK